MPAYRIKINGATTGLHVEAKNRLAARTYGRNQVEAEELTTREIVDLTNEGTEIVQVGAEPEDGQA